ncbi:hypothetical protein EV696_13011 [Permianibacter aggregans]|uniref:Uncharacterized protein n=1 Tax=Permianibacter aggregans TaxID=1510150 RepID=A0A4R6UEU9_9GAMM|nr:hypothetical protein EV696_13011 [Permianibacter aggregans]
MLVLPCQRGNRSLTFAWAQRRFGKSGNTLHTSFVLLRLLYGTKDDVLWRSHE